MSERTHSERLDEFYLVLNKDNYNALVVDFLLNGLGLSLEAAAVKKPLTTLYSKNFDLEEVVEDLMEESFAPYEILSTTRADLPYHEIGLALLADGTLTKWKGRMYYIEKEETIQ